MPTPIRQLTVISDAELSALPDLLGDVVAEAA